MNAFLARHHILTKIRTSETFWNVLKLCAGFGVSAAASYLVVAENDLTALFLLTQALVVVNLVQLPHAAIAAFYSGLFYGVFGFFAPQLLEARGLSYGPIAIAGTYLFWRVLYREVRYKWNLMLVLQILFLVVAMLSMTQQNKPLFDKSVRGLLITNTGAFLVCQAFTGDRKKLQQLLLGYGASSALMGLLSYQGFSAALGQVARLGLFERNVILVGRWAGRGLIFALLGAVVIARRPILRWVCLACTMALTPIVVLSNQRGVLLGVVLSVGSAAVGLMLTKHMEHKKSAVAWFGGLALVSSVLAVPMAINWGYRYADMLARGMSDPGITSRQLLYQDAWRQFLKYPVLGGGYQSFEAARGMYAHNIFIEIAADMGAVGLAVFVGTLVLAGVYAVRVLRAPEGQEAKPYTLLALTLLVFDLAGAQVSANLGTNSIIWFDIGMITALHTAVFSRLWKDIWPASQS